MFGTKDVSFTEYVLGDMSALSRPVWLTLCQGWPWFSTVTGSIPPESECHIIYMYELCICIFITTKYLP